MSEYLNHFGNNTDSSDILFRAVTFKMNEQLFAINILNIRDIVMGKIITRVPNSSDILVGVTNVRGEILPVFSLKKFLEMDDSFTLEQYPISVDIKEDDYLMIIKYQDYLFAVVVDNINTNISVDANSFNNSEYMTQWADNIIFSGVIVENNENILLIDIPSLVKNFVKTDLN